ncbi:MAG: peptidyl-tRNA hydrolase Pth2 [Candidatus Hodarchaeota archaeon]
MFRYKQVLVIRMDIKMGTGKKIVQGAHASILAAEKTKRQMPSVWSGWYNEGQRKIACKVQTKEELFMLKDKAEKLNLPCAIVQDAGLTQLEPGTVTALGIGPVLESDVDPITKDLKLL